MLIPAVEEWLCARNCTDIVLFGIEAHVCIQQTALELTGSGRRVWIPADGVASRFREDRQTALDRMARAGIAITSSESVLFELVRDAADPAFRSFSELIKAGGNVWGRSAKE